MKIRKGQSAIEYLTTYGWMLLVVAVVGGSIFTVIQDRSRVGSVTGFESGDVRVEDFGTGSSGGLGVVLRNAGSDVASVNSVNVSQDGEWSSWSGERSLSAGETGSVDLANISETSSGSTVEVVVDYDIGGLTGLESTGSIKADLEVTDSGSTTGDKPESMTTNEFEVTQQ